ncbi:sigma-54-dependent Fis family transcriptional regulator [Solimonas marina]|uniref:Sigma-54-dependent Fis family transcriptional regulator n=1 Tax=Solimonas marina TaxID=2714601 RepID=A0A970B694_9GAMM|nr:helix-turn-helix domain-containing protein [Solimonas marina]NKF22400.1 sigma-54-dependent Fis family transcriptional regulator [Solimonas marina]
MPTLHTPLRHARLIEDVVRGGRAAERYDPRIRDSWQRCLADYALQPSAKRQPTMVRGAELRERRERSGAIYPIAQIEMRTLTQLLNAPVGVMLTDGDGVILGYCGDPSFAEMAARAGFREGAIWSEAEQGTNGMGTCLALGTPVLIDGPEHFLSQNAGLTCCAAPIVDGRGQLVGTLNISGRLQLSAGPTQALVSLAVQNIENRALLEAHRRHHLLRFHPHREFVSTAGEGLLAFDDNGRVLAANRSALGWLDRSSHVEVHGTTVESLFGCKLERLLALSRSSAHALPLPQRDGGLLCYGILQSPATPRLELARPLADAEREALRETLERCRWNVSVAAAQLAISRRTLYRKLERHGLQRYRAG